MEFQDRATLENVRHLRNGELAASVRCAKVGVQPYQGLELGRPDLGTVMVYRPETEVMKRDSLATFAGVPVTVDHPPAAVTTDNWKQYAVGETGDEVVRDGDYVRVPILVRDVAAISAIADGKRQISMGYSASVTFESGRTPEGLLYDAVQRGVKINHCAIVDQARGGPALRIGDAKAADEPSSIDEALRMCFATKAKNQGTTVAQMLASMEQSEVEKTAMEVAKSFVSAQAGKGVATMYGDSAVLLAKSAANAMRRDALSGGAISGARGARDAAQAAQYGDQAVAGRPAPVNDAASLAGAQAMRDLARSSQY